MQAVLYSKDNCQECERAKMLFESQNISYLEYKYGKDFDRRAFVGEFGEKANFPQIAIDYEHVGSLKETLHFFKEKGLI
jgi:glutaredoxin